MTDREYMRLALREARKGEGRTSPNPCVGAVVVKDGRVIGKGYHRKAGTPHAEVHALEAAGNEARGATLYVTLEPCNHSGRTPPCTRKILDSGIRRVVVGMRDPNPLAAGGCEALAAAGVEVEWGVLGEECSRLNRPFVKLITTGKPWVVMKGAASLDGRIATRSGHSRWITGSEARRAGHRLRNRCDAILVGVGTALADDPSLTCRIRGGRDPLRVVLDSRLRLPVTARMLSQESTADTVVFCSDSAPAGKRKDLEAAGARVRLVSADKDGRLDLQQVLSELGRMGVMSLLVEGGGAVHGSFLAQGEVDEVHLFLAPFFLGGDGLPLVGPLGLVTVDQARRLAEVRVRRLQGDLLVSGVFAPQEA